MHPNIKKLYIALESLKETIESASIPGESFLQQYGWNQTALSSEDLCFAIENMLNTIKALSEEEGNDYDNYFLAQSNKIEALDKTAKGHYTANGPHLLHTASNIAVTLLVMHSDIEKTFFNWEQMAEKKLVPSQLARRLHRTEARLDSIDTSSEELEDKISAINNAHEAAENLPTDLEELKRTQRQMSELLQNSKEMLAEVQLTEKKAEAALANVHVLEEAARSSKLKTDSYVDECDEALQITTTVGLAAGFDEKAKELSKSITVWVAGLVFSLIVGGIFGALRVQELTDALAKNSSISFGEGLIQVVLTVFSIGGPLWFAWLATQQITQRFKLSEDYSYKATVAKSYTGFSKQANRFGADVEERLFNATLDRLEEMPLRLVESKDYNSPWHEFIDSDVVKNAITIVPGLARELNIYAKNTQRKMPQEKQAANQANMTDEENLNPASAKQSGTH